MNKIRLMIVDDHDMVRRGLRAYLEMEETLEIVGEASGGNEAAKLAAELKPEVILMDLIMDKGTGIEATEAIMKEYPKTKIIILTSFYDDEQVFPALEAGATSYILKTAGPDEIMEAIGKAVNDEAVIDQKVAAKMLTRIRKPEVRHDELTQRERDVLKLIGKGKTNAEIAEELFIGIKTVKTHVSNILSKLEVHDRTQAAVYAHEHKLI